MNNTDAQKQWPDYARLNELNEKWEEMVQVHIESRFADIIREHPLFVGVELYGAMRPMPQEIGSLSATKKVQSGDSFPLLDRTARVYTEEHIHGQDNAIRVFLLSDTATEVINSDKGRKGNGSTKDQES